MFSSKGIFLDAFVHLQRAYSYTKQWIAYGCIVILLLTIYADDFLGPAKDFLLPAAAITALAILFETLFQLSNNILGFLQMEEYDDIVAALPRMIETMDRNRKQVNKISVIAVSGGTTFNAILPYLYRSAKRKPIELEVLLLDPKSPLMSHAPTHWVQEINTTLERLQHEYCNGDSVEVKRCALYQNLPAIHGILINGQHLFLGYVGWVSTPSGPVMAGAQLRHRYYELNRYSQSAFELFSDWLHLAPVRNIDLSQPIDE